MPRTACEMVGVLRFPPFRSYFVTEPSESEVQNRHDACEHFTGVPNDTSLCQSDFLRKARDVVKSKNGQFLFLQQWDPSLLRENRTKFIPWGYVACLAFLRPIAIWEFCAPTYWGITGTIYTSGQLFQQGRAHAHSVTSARQLLFRLMWTGRGFSVLSCLSRVDSQSSCDNEIWMLTKDRMGQLFTADLSPPITSILKCNTLYTLKVKRRHKEKSQYH